MTNATFLRAVVLTILIARLPAAADAGDWPQFMRNPAHSGDASDEDLKLPLGLIAQVKLDDAVLTSPAIVSGRVYVVDQMGTAYCIDPVAGRIVWKSSPDGGPSTGSGPSKAMGFNTSSPCVANNRVCFGTTAGNFYILDATDGKTIKTLNLGMPIVSSPTLANDSLYVQSLDAVLHCLDLDGNVRWKWDHYARYKEPAEVTKAEAGKRGHPGSYDRPHYGGGDVSVSGKKIVTSFGWDLVCLEDKGKDVELAWCRRCPDGRDGSAPMSSSICGEWVYTCGAGADGHLGMIRVSLADGSTAPKGVPGIPVQWFTPAARDSLVATRDNGWLKDEIQVFQLDKGRATLWQDPKAATPSICSYALAKDHCVVATLRGDLMVLDLAPKPKGQPFVFKTPNGKAIGSSPAIAGGCVYFGCDDGYLYVLGPGGTLQPKKDDKLTVCEPRSKIVPATTRPYGWVSPAGDQQGTHFVDDAGLKPPLKVRWASRAYGHFKTPAAATEDGDLITVTLARTVTCQEQSTGRLRWRVRFPRGRRATGQFRGPAGSRRAGLRAGPEQSRRGTCRG